MSLATVGIGLLVFAAAAVFLWGAFLLLGEVGAKAGERYRAGVSEAAESAWLRISPEQVLALSLLSGFAFALPVALAFDFWLMAVFSGAVGLAIPSVMLRMAKRRRDARFGLQLVDALGNLSNSLKAGFSLPQAFDMIAREMDAPIKQEFGLLTQEMRLGVPMDKALGNLLGRMPGQDLDLVITSIDVSREVGGNLTEVFGNIAGTIRERQRVEGKIRMLSAQGRLQGLIMTCLPVFLGAFLSWFYPDYIDPLFNETMGRILLCCAGVMLAVGGLVIFKILAIDV